MSGWKDKYARFKTVYKWFWLWQDDEYESWLNKMSLNGWHLVGVDYYPGVRFHFIKGEPKHYVYKLDFKAIRGEEMEEYLDIFSNAGWEFVARDITWNYFRKEYSEDEANELYTDNDSQVVRYRKMLKFIIGLLIFESFIFLYELFTAVWLFRQHSAVYTAPVFSVIIILCTLPLPVLAIYKIQKKIRAYKSPIE